ncbi:hypothetical protein MGYG_06502 [Nannizzia gypsea CBS 118893]|uniref:Uncharacterized protein n=1 Tax=Arthroderma gypseum (strain ATCC MYA-4604 / CBS 118893) TaxID=535722 RepID=E4UZH4_ARTGP|nr:hypothetical protein MGYG_06502 [Nannizzia gypsea CBS 118893]EFR03504.1 hypothetical protein MGYG_06502 [Nannizzia gypsea CBS 118893]
MPRVIIAICPSGVSLILVLISAILNSRVALLRGGTTFSASCTLDGACGSEIMGTKVGEGSPEKCVISLAGLQSKRKQSRTPAEKKINMISWHRSSPISHE